MVNKTLKKKSKKKGGSTLNSLKSIFPGMPKSGNELIPYVQDGSTLYNIFFSKEDKILNKLKNFFQYINEFSEETDVERALDYQQKRLDRKKRIKMMREKLINIENELKNFVDLDSKLPLGKRIYKGIIDLCKKYPKTTIIIWF